MTNDAQRSEGHEAERARGIWRAYLMGDLEGMGTRESLMRTVFGALPAKPRCTICRVPFHCAGRVIAHLPRLGFAPSSLNPHLCDRCERYVRQYEVGAEVEATLLFADVRGSTTLAERLGPSEFSAVIARFFKVAASVLVRADALVDKLIGDEVVALFVPGVAGPDYARRAVEAALELLEATGHTDPGGPWVPVGAGVHTGSVYLGSVGSSDSVGSITVLGDPANATARLASVAAAGEVLVTDEACGRARLDLSACESRTLELKGRTQPMTVRVLPAGAALTDLKVASEAGV